MKTILITLTLAFSTLSSAESYKLNCEGELFSDFYATFKYEGSIDILGENDYWLGHGTVDLKLLYEKGDNEDPWHTDFAKTTPMENNKKYRPQRYKGFVQFPNMAPISGKADLVIPRYAFEGPQVVAEFNAAVILTWVTDHWGGTIPLKCSIL